MLLIIAVSVLAYSAEGLLFPNNNGMEPEPELLFVCPPPRAPQFGSIKCDYSLLDMSCTAQCDAGFVFEDGQSSAAVMCDLIEGGRTDTVPKCVRVGGATGLPIVTSAPATLAPSTSNNCVRTVNDCYNKLPGDYAYCDDCRKFATCASSGFYVRECPQLSVFDVANDRCTDRINFACKLSV